MKKVCFFLIVLTISSLCFSLKIDKYFINIDLIDYKEVVVPFVFVNDKNYEQIIQIKNLSKNDFVDISYPKTIYLNPYETQNVNFVVSPTKINVGSYFFFFQFSIENNFINEIGNIYFPILFRINIIPQFDYHPTVEIYSGDLHISYEDKLGTIFPFTITNDSNLILEISGNFRLTSKENSNFIVEKPLFEGYQSAILPQTEKDFEIFIDRYLKPGKYRIRMELNYGYKNYLQEKYVLEKEFTIPETIYLDRKAINFVVNKNKLYISVPKEMSTREYITTPQQETLTILNNDYIDANLSIDFISSTVDIPLERSINPKYISENPSKISLKPDEKGEINLIADYRRANLQNLEGEFFGTVQLISEGYSREKIFYNTTKIPTVINFGNNKYEVKSNVTSIELIPINKFNKNLNFKIDIENTGNSTLLYQIKINKFNKQIGKKVGEEIRILPEKPILPEQSISINNQLIVELGVDTIIIDIEYCSYTDPKSIIKTYSYSFTL